MDDALLLFGVSCLVCAEALLLACKDDMYLAEALLLRPTQAKSPSNPADLEARTLTYTKLMSAAMLLCWIAVAAVKFSFLFLFRAFLSHSARPWRGFWWFVAVFNLAVVTYGVASNFLPCPYLNSADSCEPNFELANASQKLMTMQSRAAMARTAGSFCATALLKLPLTSSVTL